MCLPSFSFAALAVCPYSFGRECTICSTSQFLSDCLSGLLCSQVIGLAFLVGATFAPTLTSFAVCRCLSGIFSTSAQVLGLYICTDLYPVHKQPTRCVVANTKCGIQGFAQTEIGLLHFPSLLSVALWTFGYLGEPNCAGGCSACFC